MKKFKLIAIATILCMLVGMMGIFVGCGDTTDETKIFRIVALQGGRGETYVNKLVEEFKKDSANADMEYEIQYFPSTTIGTELNSMINSGKNPDLLFASTNMSGEEIVARFIKEKNVVDTTDVLEMTVPGESTKVKDKLVSGILDNYTCQPYGNSKTYLMPAFYSPTGLFYDTAKFGEGKYTLPTTMTEFFALGDTLKATSGAPALFTYPTAGYFDSVVYPLIAGYAGLDKYVEALGFADGIWENANVKEALKQIVKLRSYLEKDTHANAVAENGFTTNQQTVIDGKALFVPNGDWLPGEMSATTPEGFEWGFMPYPKKDTNADSYINSFIETMLIHNSSDNQDMAKRFMAFYYSDAAAKIVASESKAIIPTKQALTNAKTNGIGDATISLYEAYNTSKVVVGAFAATNPVPDVIWGKILFDDSIQSFMDPNKLSTKSDDELVNEWSAALEAASDKLRPQIIK